MRREPNYLHLLICLVAAIILIMAGPPRSVVRVCGLFALMLTTIFLVSDQKRRMLVPALFGLGAISLFVWATFFPASIDSAWTHAFHACALALWLAFTLYIGRTTLRGILSALHVRANQIYGAIYLYLLIGLVFAQVFQVLFMWQPDALFFDPARFPAAADATARTPSPGDFIYFSFATLATVGYGDVTPATPAARAASLIESVGGIMYVAIMIARFVATRTSDAHRRHDPAP